MTITARVFLSGRSQALRLLARLKLQAKEVRLEQIGKDIWLHPGTLPEQDMGLWLQQFYADTEPLPWPKTAWSSLSTRVSSTVCRGWRWKRGR